MAKLQDVEFPKGTHPSFWEFFDRTQQILNSGRYQLRVLSTEPDWAGDDGEMVVYETSDGSKFLYVYVTDGWTTLNTLVIENRTSDPESPATGQIWLRTDL